MVGVHACLQTHIHKEAIIAVNIGSSQVLTIHGNDAFAHLSSGFGKQLLKPSA